MLIRSVLLLFFVFLYAYTWLCFVNLSPWQQFVVLVAQRLNEECVQKPFTERTHSEGTSRRTGHRERHTSARRLTQM